MKPKLLGYEPLKAAHNSDAADALADRVAARIVTPVPLLLSSQAAAAFLGVSEDNWARAKAAAGPDFPKPRRVPGRADLMYHRDDIFEFSKRLEKDRSALPGRRGRSPVVRDET